MFKVFSFKYHSLNEQTKKNNELVSFINESLPLDNQSELTAIPIRNNDDVLLNEQNQNEYIIEKKLKNSCANFRTGNCEVCRICYSTGDLQSLISPCECTGTMGIFHQHCLERWLEISNTTKCEICQHEFEVVRYSKSLFHVKKKNVKS